MTHKYAGTAHVLQKDVRYVHLSSQRQMTHIRSTTKRTTNDSVNPRPKKAGPALPVLNARILKLHANHSQNIWYILLSVR